MPFSRAALIAIPALLLVGSPASAQNVRVGAGGVHVQGADGETVDVGAGGVRVRNPKSTKGSKGSEAEPSPHRPNQTGAGEPTGEVAQGPVTCTSEDLTMKGEDIHGEIGLQVIGACDIFYRSATIEVTKTGVLIRGSGTVTLKDVTIRTPGIGIRIEGSGDVLIHNAIIEGGKAAISILGSGSVMIKRSKVKGKIERLGTGEVSDVIGNTFE